MAEIYLKNILDELFKQDDVSFEVFARIFKAAAKKYGYEVEIDFENGKRIVVFEGEPEAKEHIEIEIKESMNRR